MQRTSNYQLPQWEKSDRIMMEDFNGMTEKIDAGIKDAKDAAGDAKQTALTHRNYSVGTYTGTTSTIKIQLGYRPSAVVITRKCLGLSNNTTEESAGSTTLFIEGAVYPGTFAFEDDGFSVPTQDYSFEANPKVNRYGRQYGYIAFR